MKNITRYSPCGYGAMTEDEGGDYVRLSEIEPRIRRAVDQATESGLFAGSMIAEENAEELKAARYALHVILEAAESASVQANLEALHQETQFEQIIKTATEAIMREGPIKRGGQNEPPTKPKPDMAPPPQRPSATAEELANLRDLLRWRKVGEEMPDDFSSTNGRMVLTMDYTGVVRILPVWSLTPFSTSGVTHWRPIGPLPEGGNC